MPRITESAGSNPSQGTLLLGDDDQFITTAYRLYRPLILRFLLAKTHRMDEAEDMTQDVFVAAVAAARRLRVSGRPILPWLYSVAARRYVDHLRRRPPWLLVELEASTAAVAVVELHEIVGPLALGLKSLTPSQRRICSMRLIQGCAFSEISARLALPEPACRVQYARGLKRLREELETSGIGVI